MNHTWVFRCGVLIVGKTFTLLFMGAFFIDILCKGFAIHPPSCRAMESILLLTSYNPFDTCQNLCLYSIETITLGDKRIGIRTSVLEEKATACNMLCCYADELKEGFFPWIDQVRYRTKHIKCLIFSSLSCSFPTYIINTNLHVGCPHIGPSAEVLLP